MRGLKQPILTPNFRSVRVASFTDAWIETACGNKSYDVVNVASFTDAWIETREGLLKISSLRSHLLQMRGLKLFARQWRAFDV